MPESFKAHGEQINQVKIRQGRQQLLQEWGFNTKHRFYSTDQLRLDVTEG